MTEDTQAPAPSTLASPNVAQELIARGWTNYAGHHYQEAVDDFQQALHIDEKLIDAQYGLGISMRRLDETDKALKAMSRALELAEDEATVVDPARRTILRSLIASQIAILTGSMSKGS